MEIWLPDEDGMVVEWYVSEGRAVGVQSIRSNWHREQVEPPRKTGFEPPRDPR